jgi:hypothetical protein
MKDKKMPGVKPQEAVDHAHDFVHVISRLSHGELAEQAGMALKKVHAAVVETGKDGEITLKIKIKPSGGRLDVMVLNPSITTKAPSPDLNGDYFYRNVNTGRITSDDYTQKTFEFVRPEEKGTTIIKMSGDGGGEIVDPETGEVNE